MVQLGLNLSLKHISFRIWVCRWSIVGALHDIILTEADTATCIWFPIILVNGRRERNRSRVTMVLAILASHIALFIVLRQVLRGSHRLLLNAYLVAIGSTWARGSRVCKTNLIKLFHRTSVVMRANASRRKSTRGISRAWVKSVIILVVLGIIIKRCRNAYLMALFLLLLSMKQLATLILGKRLRVSCRWSFSERFTIAYAGKRNFIASCPLVIWLG